MMEEHIPLSEVSFKSNTTGTYDKEFGKKKDELREQGFPEKETRDFVESLLTDKVVKKFEKNTPNDSLLLSMPIKSGSTTPNTMPRMVAEILAEKTGRKHIDLSDYLNVRQEKTARKTHSSTARSENHFNISFKHPEKELELRFLLRKQPNILVDDVLTTGETMVGMATYLNWKIADADIEKGHALVSVDNRTPTVRDITRLSEKLADNLPPGTNRISIMNTVHEALSNFTRKKLMRFEIKSNTPEGAKEQYNSLQKEVEKMQNSLVESFAGNLFRYPLDNNEIEMMKETSVIVLPQSIMERAIMDFYPDAKISESADGSFRIFKDDAMKEELSLTGQKNMDLEEAVRNAGEYIQVNNLNVSIKRGNDLSM